MSESEILPPDPLTTCFVCPIFVDMVNTALGQRRQRIGLSQSETARMIGLTRPRLSAIENGAVIPQTQTVIKLAEVLKCDPNAILRDLGLL